ncbi:MAG TPA: ABC transporter ATP-binding protein [Chloroflexia bacterium]|nr:ABC transporter ATP-binding protein [Chloroflexia bacterium]
MTIATSPKITINNVTKVYLGTSRSVTALDQVSLDIQANEFVVVVGPSGCGKTTLLNIIAGLEKATSGEVQVDGKVVREPGSDRGVIFQQYALFPWLTVQQNVEFGLKIKGVPRQERAKIARHYLELVGLKDFPNALPKELSGGMKQRCAIARAYAVNPSILLMDEPFAALDALTRVQMQEQLQATWEQERKTAFFITHDVEEAVFLGTRVIIMKHGGIQGEIRIDLPFPRNNEMRLTQDFVNLRNQVWKGVYLRDEIN